MKTLILIAFLIGGYTANAQLTLSQKSTIASSQVFRDRIYQALFAKANVYLPQSPLNLAWQKQVNFASYFMKGGAATIDMQVISRFWLANYNGVPVLDSNGQPTDTEILNSQGLDIVFNKLANVLPGDDQLPIIQ